MTNSMLKSLVLGSLTFALCISNAEGRSPVSVLKAPIPFGEAQEIDVKLDLDVFRKGLRKEIERKLPEIVDIEDLNPVILEHITPRLKESLEVKIREPFVIPLPPELPVREYPTQKPGLLDELKRVAKKVKDGRKIRDALLEEEQPMLEKKKKKKIVVTIDKQKEKGDLMQELHSELKARFPHLHQEEEEEAPAPHMIVFEDADEQEGEVAIHEEEKVPTIPPLPLVKAKKETLPHQKSFETQLQEEIARRKKVPDCPPVPEQPIIRGQTSKPLLPELQAKLAALKEKQKQRAANDLEREAQSFVINPPLNDTETIGVKRPKKKSKSALVQTPAQTPLSELEIAFAKRQTHKKASAQAQKLSVFVENLTQEQVEQIQQIVQPIPQDDFEKENHPQGQVMDVREKSKKARLSPSASETIIVSPVRIRDLEAPLSPRSLNAQESGKRGSTPKAEQVTHFSDTFSEQVSTTPHKTPSKTNQRQEMVQPIPQDALDKENRPQNQGMEVRRKSKKASDFVLSSSTSEAVIVSPVRIRDLEAPLSPRSLNAQESGKRSSTPKAEQVTHFPDTFSERVSTTPHKTPSKINQQTDIFAEQEFLLGPFSPLAKEIKFPSVREVDTSQSLNQQQVISPVFLDENEKVLFPFSTLSQKTNLTPQVEREQTQFSESSQIHEASPSETLTPEPGMRSGQMLTPVSPLASNKYVSPHYRYNFRRLFEEEDNEDDALDFGEEHSDDEFLGMHEAKEPKGDFAHVSLEHDQEAMDGSGLQKAPPPPPMIDFQNWKPQKSVSASSQVSQDAPKIVQVNREVQRPKVSPSLFSHLRGALSSRRLDIESSPDASPSSPASPNAKKSVLLKPREEFILQSDYSKEMQKVLLNLKKVLKSQENLELTLTNEARAKLNRNRETLSYYQKKEYDVIQKAYQDYQKIKTKEDLQRRQLEDIEKKQKEKVQQAHSKFRGLISRAKKAVVSFGEELVQKIRGKESSKAPPEIELDVIASEVAPQTPIATSSLIPKVPVKASVQGTVAPFNMHMLDRFKELKLSPEISHSANGEDDDW